MFVATFAMYGWRPLNKTHINAISVEIVNTNGVKLSLFVQKIIANIIAETQITFILGKNPLFLRICVYSFAPKNIISITPAKNQSPPASNINNAEKPTIKPVKNLFVSIIRS